MHNDFTSVNLVWFLFHMWFLTCRLLMVDVEYKLFLLPFVLLVFMNEYYVFLEM